MLAVYKQIAYAADSAAPVLILGESGTGKELVAGRFTATARARRGRLSPSTAARFPETLLESELFGHTRGAFTGAVADRKGIIEQASGGTVLLDEIGETSLALQVRLLRTIEEGEVRPVGAGRTVKVDARVISATNRDLEKEVAAQRFRQDLYYRLSVIVITVPPLESVASDIPLLVAQFLQNASARAGRTVDLCAGGARCAHGLRLAGQRARAREHDRAAGALQPRLVDSRRRIYRRRSVPSARATQLHTHTVRGPAVARRARAAIPASTSCTPLPATAPARPR